MEQVVRMNSFGCVWTREARGQGLTLPPITGVLGTTVAKPSVGLLAVIVLTSTCNNNQ